METNEAIKTLKDHKICFEHDFGWNRTVLEALDFAIQSLAAADVVPVRHGRWVVSRTDYSWNGAEFPTHCKCDQCGREIPYLDRDAYCPNCGARMDGDGDV